MFVDVGACVTSSAWHSSIFGATPMTSMTFTRCTNLCSVKHHLISSSFYHYWMVVVRFVMKYVNNKHKQQQKVQSNVKLFEEIRNWELEKKSSMTEGKDTDFITLKDKFTSKNRKWFGLDLTRKLHYHVIVCLSVCLKCFLIKLYHKILHVVYK